MALDLVNALLSWLTARYGDALLAGAKRGALGDDQQRAFRRIVSDAINRTVETVAQDQTADQRDFLIAVLREHPERLEDLESLQDLAAVLRAFVATLDEPPDLGQAGALGALSIDPASLAEALTEEIGLGVTQDARVGGPLAPLVTDANFARLLSLGAEAQTLLAEINAKVDAITNELGGRGAPITINNFVGGWHRLADSYLDPSRLRATILQEPFTGRQWLLSEIEAFIEANDRGYFIIQADAGTGKTAFALWYSGLDKRPFHFTAYSKDARRTDCAVRNLAAQLIMLWGLDELAPGRRLPAEADWSSWLRLVLTAAAKRRDEKAQRRPIVLVVDGLDEAEERDSAYLPFGLPDELPYRVYVVATVRHGARLHQPKPPVQWCDWNWRTDHNLADLRAFVTKAAQQTELARAIRNDGLTPEAFVTSLLDRCGDVWLYVHYVLEEIKSGRHRPRDVPLLPHGLEGYYYNTIEGFRRPGIDEAWRMPLLATLAVAAEPLEVQTLADFAGLDDPLAVELFLTGPMRPFCTVLPADRDHGRDRFVIKHGSFREYLTAGAGPRTEDRSEDARALRVRLAAECRKAEHRLCDRYLTAWGGLDAGLPALAEDPLLAQRDGGYPLRWLSTHLLATGRADELHRLLSCERHDRNLWYTAHEYSGDTAGFLADVEQARRATDQLAAAASGQRRGREDVGRKVRYSLIEAGVASASTNITPELLAVLVERKPWTWTPARALSVVERMTDEKQQVRALLHIAGQIPPSLVPRAWSVAVTCREEEPRSRALAAIIPRLPDDLLGGAVQAVAGLEGQAAVPRAAAALVERLPQDRLDDIPWQAMPEMEYEQKMGIHALVALKRSGPSAAETALACIEEIDNEFDRCQFLAALIPSLPERAFDGALSVLAACPASYRGDPLIALARHAPIGRINDLLEAARDDVAWQSPPCGAEPRPWWRMMAELGPRLSPAQEAGTLSLAQSFLVEWSAEAIEVLAPHLTAESARQALREIDVDFVRWDLNDDGRWEMIAVTALAGRLLPAEARAVVERCVKRRCSVDDGLDVVLGPRDAEPSSFEAELLAPAASYLPRDTVRQALRAICRGMSSTTRFAEELSPALSRLAPAVCRDAAVWEAFDMMLKPSVWRPVSRLTVLSVLAPHLPGELLDQAMDRVLPGLVEGECFAAIAALGRELSDEQRRGDVARRAWHTAQDIGNIEHRTRVVAALAPTLPDDLVHEALEFVGSVTRRVLWQPVLCALDALAPHLPATLLPRALEIFMDTPMVDSGQIKRVTRLIERLGRDDPRGALRNHFVGPEPRLLRPWDSWLWTLAPFLSADLAREALPVARALPAPDSRRYALAALAPRLPQEFRAAVAGEVLELLPVLPDDFTVRASVLARLAAATATDEVITACDSFLTGIRIADIRHGESWNAFLEFLAHLPSGVAERALPLTTRLFLDQRCGAVRALAARLPVELLPDVIASLEAAKPAMGLAAELREHGLALVALAMRTPDEYERRRVLAAVLNRAVTRRWWLAYGRVFVELIPLLPPPQRHEAVEFALRDAIGPYARSDDVHELDPLFAVLDGPGLEMGFHELTKVRDPHVRANAMAAVLRRAGELPDPSTAFAAIAVHSSWPPGITRAELFDLVAASAWWIRQHGDERAVAATIDAAFDVSRWWR
jgi:hypothetical protein